MAFKVFLDPSLCTGCEICLLACSLAKTGGFNPRVARMRVVNSDGLLSMPEICWQCSNAYCARVCPASAIISNTSNGAIVVQVERCSGCKLCEQYCPNSMIHVSSSNGVAEKCDLCGGNPECVKFCPTGALTIAEVSH